MSMTNMVRVDYHTLLSTEAADLQFHLVSASGSIPLLGVCHKPRERRRSKHPAAQGSKMKRLASAQGLSPLSGLNS